MHNWTQFPEAINIWARENKEWRLFFFDLRYSDLREYGVTRFSNLVDSFFNNRIFFVNETQAESASEPDEIGNGNEEVVDFSIGINLEVDRGDVQELLESPEADNS
ncbi:hypothetical protein TNCV_1139181 [Trichonephila clavipes]|nr:hypothetical protein TNCV_1139181 [Trichonephila clavipes]